MRRFVCLVILLLFTIPFGISISGCSKKSAAGAVLQWRRLRPRGRPGNDHYAVAKGLWRLAQLRRHRANRCALRDRLQRQLPSAVSTYTYGSTDTTMTIVDVQPNTGPHLRRHMEPQLRRRHRRLHLSASPPTRAEPPPSSRARSGANSNPLPVYVHPVVTSVVLGPPCRRTVRHRSGDKLQPRCVFHLADKLHHQSRQRMLHHAPGLPARPTCSNACLSQGTTGQLAARVYPDRCIAAPTSAARSGISPTPRRLRPS